MQRTQENCRGVIDGLIAEGRRPNGETGARRPTGPACVVWSGPETFDLSFPPKGAG